MHDFLRVVVVVVAGANVTVVVFVEGANVTVVMDFGRDMGSWSCYGVG